ncbi:MAG: transporter substrate-binding domain-containing protein, partial [Draconibacterium sp.]|nr:transporter substrate-binding domain-containing protein [Draconibacterium sp.]
MLKAILEPYQNSCEIITTTTPLESFGAVLNGHADLAIGTNFNNYLIGKHSLTGIQMMYLDFGHEIPISTGIRRDWPELVDILNKALAQIGSAQIQQILNRWTGAEILSEQLFLTEEEQIWLNENGTIRVGNEPDYAPYDFQIDGRPTGYSIEYLDLLAKILGLEIEYVQGSWDNLNEQIRNKEIDIIHPVLPVSQKHDEYLNFTNSFKKVISGIVVESTNKEIGNLGDLKNKSVVFVKGDAVLEGLQEYLKKSELIFEDSYEEAIKAVAMGRADAMITELSVATYFKNSLSLTNLSIVDEIDLPDLRDTEYHFAVQKDKPILVSLLNKAMKVLSAETIQQLDNKWLTTQNAVSLSTLEKTWLNEHSIIKVGVSPNISPLEFMDDNGRYNGLAIDYLYEIEDLLNIKFEFVEDNLDSKYDIFLSHASFDEKQGYIHTQPYLEIPMGVFAKDRVNYISDVSRLNGKEIALIDGSVLKNYFETHFPEVKINSVKSPEEAIESVLNNNSFAYIDNALTTGQLLRQKGHMEIEMIGEVPIKSIQRIGIREDWPVLKDIVQKAVDAIPVSERNRLYNKWIPLVYESSFDYSLLWKIGIGILLVILMVLFWNRRLAVVVQNRTKELQESEEKFRKVFEVSHDANVLITENRFVECNTATLEMFGFDNKDEILKKHPVDLSPEIQPDGKSSLIKANELMEEAFKGESRAFEWIHMRKDGSLFSAEVLLSPMSWKGQDVLQAVIRDISERKQAEEALLESEEKYRTFFENSADAMLMLFDDKFFDLNTATTTILGYDNKEELLNISPWQLSPKFQPDGKESVVKAREMMNIAHSKGSHQFEWDHIKKDKSILPVEVSLTAIPFKGKEVLMVVWRDITSRKEAENALKDNQRKLNAIFDHHFQLTGLIDTEGRLLASNRTALRFAGKKESDVLGMFFWDGPWWEEDQKQMVKEKFERAVNEGVFIRFETTHPNKDGEIIHFDFSYNPVKDDDGNVIYVVPEGRDISAIRKAEEELRENEIRLRNLGDNIP